MAFQSRVRGTLFALDVSLGNVIEQQLGRVENQRSEWNRHARRNYKYLQQA
jgi:hypothetical protein